MTVARTDANGAGSRTSPVSANTTTDSATSTTGGLADGPNTTWRKEPVRVADASARPASLNFRRIKESLGNVGFAELRFVAAHNQHVQKRSDESEKAYNEAKKQYGDAQINLGETIKDETNRLARDSSVYRRGHGLKNCGDLRQWERKILDQAGHPHERDQLEKAICENRSLRAPRELIALSQAMASKHRLNDTQAKEGRHIIADGTDAVTGKREGDDDLTREEVVKKQLDRLDNLLKTITTRVDGATGEVHKFDKALYSQLTENIRAKLGDLDPANNQSFDDLVRKYRPS
jgi:chaperonin cofactor prefoldin